MKKLYNMLLALASTSPMILIFSVNARHRFFASPITFFPNNPLWNSHIMLLICVSVFNLLCIASMRLLSKDSIEGTLTNVELANGSFLPNYLGYFFVAVSITNVDTFFLVYTLTVVFVMLSQTMYFNPFLLIFNYNFYHMTDESGTQLFIISKEEIRNIRTEGFEKLRRINDVTYIDF